MTVPDGLFPPDKLALSLICPSTVTDGDACVEIEGVASVQLMSTSGTPVVSGVKFAFGSLA
ncbi:MAG: hypothetical protein ACRDVW_03595 [Acidimicrobiales bacterium]